MPTRLLRDWTDSAPFDGISAEAERLFTRLIMKADDYGRFHADPRLIKGNCFPLLETLRTEHIGRWLDELSHRNLVFRYEVGHRKLLAIINFGQRLRQTKAKFPPPKDEPDDWLPQSAAICRNMRPEAETYSDADTEAEAQLEAGELQPATIPDGMPKTKEQAISSCSAFAVEPEFVAEVWVQMVAVGFQDSSHRRLNSFPSYIQKRWTREEMKWRAEKNGNAPGSKRKPEMSL